MKKIKGFDFVVIAIVAGLVALLDIVGVIGLPTGVLSVSSLYIAAAFYLLFIASFKVKGIIAVYFGLSSDFTCFFRAEICANASSKVIFFDMNFTLRFVFFTISIIPQKAR